MTDEGQNKDAIRHVKRELEKHQKGARGVQRAFDRLQNSIKPITKRLEKWSAPLKNIDFDLLKCHSESFFNRPMYAKKGSSLYAWKTYVVYRKRDRNPPKWVFQVFDEIGDELLQMVDLPDGERNDSAIKRAIGLKSGKDFFSFRMDARNLEGL